MSRQALLCALALSTALGLSTALAAADYPREWFLNAHNCYPEHGRGADRLERARRAGLRAIEIDLGWSEARNRTVITHDPKKLDGDEPTLEDYFLAPMLPELRAGGAPVLLLLDFKNDHPGPVNEVHALLGRYRELLTTFGEEVSWKPLTVLLDRRQAGHCGLREPGAALPGDGEP